MEVDQSSPPHTQPPLELEGEEENDANKEQQPEPQPSENTLPTEGGLDEAALTVLRSIVKEHENDEAMTYAFVEINFEKKSNPRCI